MAGIQAVRSLFCVFLVTLTLMVVGCNPGTVAGPDLGPETTIQTQGDEHNTGNKNDEHNTGGKNDEHNTNG